MKSQYDIKLRIVVILLFLIISPAFGENLKKSITKSFNISSETRLELDNKYGDIIIKKWDKNVVDLKVTIEAKGSSDSKNQKILDAIDLNIDDRIASGYLSISTEIGKISGSSNFSIKYEISMPNTNPMNLANSFGNVYLGSYTGLLNLSLKYGQLMAEDLDKANISIEFASSRCEIETMNSGLIDLKYSKMSIIELGNVEINSQFSELSINKAGKINVDGKYGKLDISSVKNLSGDLQFSGLTIGNLDESIILTTRHGDGIKLKNVSNKFKQIEIEGQFGSVDITLAKGAASRLEFDLQFGNLKADGTGINFSKVIKDHNSSTYSGYLGNSNAGSIIKVTNKFGNVNLTAG